MERYKKILIALMFLTYMTVIIYNYRDTIFVNNTGTSPTDNEWFIEYSHVVSSSNDTVKIAYDCVNDYVVFKFNSEGIEVLFGFDNVVGDFVTLLLTNYLNRSPDSPVTGIGEISTIGGFDSTSYFVIGDVNIHFSRDLKSGNLQMLFEPIMSNNSPETFIPKPLSFKPSGVKKIMNDISTERIGELR